MENNSEYDELAESNIAEDFELPPQFKVILHNDDFTTKDFVVEILMSIFKKTEQEAESVMNEVHVHGKGVAGIYPYDVAATRATQTMKKARAEGFPLQCTLEKC